VSPVETCLETNDHNFRGGARHACHTLRGTLEHPEKWTTKYSVLAEETDYTYEKSKQQRAASAGHTAIEFEPSRAVHSQYRHDSSRKTTLPTGIAKSTTLGHSSPRPHLAQMLPGHACRSGRASWATPIALDSRKCARQETTKTRRVEGH
jgi:hypothetical protein